MTFKATTIAAVLASATVLTMTSAQAFWGPFNSDNNNSGWGNGNGMGDMMGDIMGDVMGDVDFTMSFKARGQGRGRGNSAYNGAYNGSNGSNGASYQAPANYGYAPVYATAPAVQPQQDAAFKAAVAAQQKEQAEFTLRVEEQRAAMQKSFEEMVSARQAEWDQRTASAAPVAATVTTAPVVDVTVTATPEAAAVTTK